MKILSAPLLVKGARPHIMPLSFAQQNLWFLNRLEESAPNYNETVTLRFNGVFDRGALIAALTCLVRRHEILRTVFPESQGNPRQHIMAAKTARVPLTCIETDDDHLPTQVAEAAQPRFDLTRERPLRAYLFNLHPEHHVLALVIHHIVIDGWSVRRVLIRDLVAMYEACRLGRAAKLPALTVQYADYVLWQRRVLGAEDDPDSRMSRQLKFWKAALHGLPDQLMIAGDRRRSMAPTFLGGIVELEIDKKLHADLAELARRNRSTMFMVLHAGLAALLTRLGAGTDIPIGSPVSGRSTTALDDLVGLFANTIVVRTDTSGNPAFCELLARVRRRVLDACAHDDLPFERLVEALNPVRSLSRNPLFQVMLAFQPHSRVSISELTDHRITRGAVPVRANRALFDLMFKFVELRAGPGAVQGIRGSLVFSGDLFDPATAKELAAAFVHILRAAVSNPAQTIDEIDLSAPSVKQRLLQVGEDSARANLEPLLIARFEDQVIRRNKAPAAISQGQQLCYQQLNLRANRLAHHLLSLGVGPEDVVAFVLGRSLEMVVSLLAILKTGATCLPLDSDYPAQYLASVMSSARPRWIVTSRDAAGAIPDGMAVIILDCTEVSASLAQAPTSNPTETDRRQPLLFDNAALLVHTAGTTRSERGVIISHRALASVMSAMEDAVPITPNERLLATNAVGSDVGMIEILRPLMTGAVLVVASSDELSSSRLLSGLIEQTGITVVHGNPGLVRMIAAHRRQDGSDLAFTVGRQILTPAALRVLHRSAHRVTNCYGVTECTGWTTCALDTATGDEMSVGKAIANARAYVLDRRLRPVPPGVMGDLYVAGTGLARGYFQAAGLTAATLVANPHGPPGSRMCQTGDRGRFSHSGNLQFFGRRQEHVIVGGRSVDTHAVEMALCACPGIDEAVTTVCPNVVGADALIAHVVTGAGDVLDSQNVQHTLSQTLPSSFVPAAVVKADSLPRTPHGTIDRKRLVRGAVSTAPGTRLPKNACEANLCSLFAEILEVASVTPEDNFFKLGGHSLLVTKFVNRVRTRLGIEMDLRLLFDAPTVAGLARHLSDQSVEPPERLSARSRPPISPGE